MSTDNVNCPALERIIDFGYCQELQMATDDAIIWEGLEDVFNDTQKSVCKALKNRTNPALV